MVPLIDLADKHLTIFDAALFAVVLPSLLLRRRRAFVVVWVMVTSLMVVVTWVLSRLASMLYVDARPHTIIHLTPLSSLRPLLPHAATNSFPSGHAVLTGVIAAAVLLVSRRWAIPFIIIGFLVEWARMGVGIHQAIDSIGGWMIVGLATIIAFAPGCIAAALTIPHVSRIWREPRPSSQELSPHSG